MKRIKIGGFIILAIQLIWPNPLDASLNIAIKPTEKKLYFAVNQLYLNRQEASFQGFRKELASFAKFGFDKKVFRNFAVSAQLHYANELWIFGNSLNRVSYKQLGISPGFKFRKAFNYSELEIAYHLYFCKFWKHYSLNNQVENSTKSLVFPELDFNYHFKTKKGINPFIGLSLYRNIYEYVILPVGNTYRLNVGVSKTILNKRRKIMN